MLGEGRLASFWEAAYSNGRKTGSRLGAVVTGAERRLGTYAGRETEAL